MLIQREHVKGMENVLLEPRQFSFINDWRVDNFA
jgi:hypothetical protein